MVSLPMDAGRINQRDRMSCPSSIDQWRQMMEQMVMNYPLSLVRCDAFRTSSDTCAI